MFTRREVLKSCFAVSAVSLLNDRFGLINDAFAAPAIDLSSIISPGTRVLDFLGTKWASNSGSPLLSRNNKDMSSRTGTSAMLRWGALSSNNEAIQIDLKDMPGTQPISFNGRLGIWIYCKNQPGYGPQQSPSSSIGIEMSTDPSGNWSSGFGIWINVLQLREGWNFLKYITNPVGHPEGVGGYQWGMSPEDILKRPVYAIKIYSDTGSNTGATWYLDSLWTDFKNRPQIVFGCDADPDELLSYCLPVFQRYGWSGYVAAPYRVWTSGSTRVSNWDTNRPVLREMGFAGWETINHTVNHLRLGNLTSQSNIRYEIVSQNSFLRLLGLSKGLSFYASPYSSTSRLSESVIKGAGIVVQRHYRKHNTSITQFGGVDNPHHIGAFGLDLLSFAKIKAQIDIIVAYEDTNFPYWHSITALGDPGDGSSYASVDTMYKSTWDMTMNYVRSLELNGKIRVKKGFGDFLYGTN